MKDAHVGEFALLSAEKALGVAGIVYQDEEENACERYGKDALDQKEPAPR
jgi:hypothetical protein